MNVKFNTNEFNFSHEKFCHVHIKQCYHVHKNNFKCHVHMDTCQTLRCVQVNNLNFSYSHELFSLHMNNFVMST